MKKTLCYCDRCGDDMHPSEKNFVLKTSKLFLRISSHSSLDLDLCSQCTKDVKEFVSKPLHEKNN